MARPKYVFNKIVMCVVLSGVIYFSGCELEEGWPWFRNMYDSPGPQPQEDSLVLPDLTLPTEGGELAGFPLSEESLKNPEETEPSEGAGEKGKMLFNQFCAVCHGEHAEGVEMTEDFFTPDLTEEDYLDYADEDLYNLLIDGGISMPSYREELTFRERWLVIDHLRTLQRDHEQ